MRVGNLNSVDVLIYSHHRNLTTLQQAALNGFGVRKIENTRRFDQFQESIRHVYRDIIIINHEADMDIGPFLTEIRDGAAVNPFAIVILMSATTSPKLLREALRHGVDGVMTIPFTANDLWRQLVYAVNRTRTFVRTKSYFGPDRRRIKNIPYTGEERRDDAEIVGV